MPRAPMSGRCKLLLLLAIVQMLVAGALYLDHLGTAIKGVEYRTYQASETIAGSLRAAGVDVPSLDSGGGSAAFEAIARPVRSRLHEAEDRVGLATLLFLMFAGLFLLLALLPDRWLERRRSGDQNNPPQD
ncbi:MAG: hypothetical protein RIE32_13740 [Phycisphaerales bacterium]